MRHTIKLKSLGEYWVDHWDNWMLCKWTLSRIFSIPPKVNRIVVIVSDRAVGGATLGSVSGYYIKIDRQRSIRLTSGAYAWLFDHLGRKEPLKFWFWIEYRDEGIMR